MFLWFTKNLEIPLRPIVSFANTPTYEVSSFQAKILSPVVGNTANTVKNSCHFAEFVRGKTLNADQVLVLFDVSTPHTLCLRAVIINRFLEQGWGHQYRQ